MYNYRKDIIGTENTVKLCESDNNDLSEILNTVFPDCNDKMKVF